MTKIESTEILSTTKTILKSSDRFRYVKVYVDFRDYTDPNVFMTMINDVITNLQLYHISEACFSVLYLVMMTKIVELLTGMN